jgi:FkbM family methyltransferase
MYIFKDKLNGFEFCVDTITLANKWENEISKYKLIKWLELFLTSDGVFVDIGANVGIYSLLLSSKCKKVYAFEPQKVKHSCFKINLALNNINNVICNNTSLGTTKEYGILYHIKNSDVTIATLNKVSNETELSNSGTEPTEINTLDNFCISDIELIKLSAENYEIEVLKGAVDTLKKNNYPPILFNNKEEGLTAYIKELGYEIISFDEFQGCLLALNHPNRQSNGTLYHKACIAKLTSPSEAYDLIKIGLKNERQNKWSFLKELSVICSTLGKREEGIRVCDELLLSTDIKSQDFNSIFDNQVSYMRSLPLIKTGHIKFNVSNNYTSSSCSLLNFIDGYKIVVRTVNYKITDNGSYIISDKSGGIQSKNLLLIADKNLNITNETEFIDNSGITKYSKTIQGMEDIRLVGSNYFLCTYPEINKSSIPQICLGHYTENGSVYKIIPLKIGKDVIPEKNWMPFIDNDNVYFIYSMAPFKLYKLNTETGATDLVKSSDLTDQRNKNISSFRGSSCPVRYKEGWLFTIHQVNPGCPCKYAHRFVWLNSEFDNIKYSEPFYFEKIGIEFNMALTITETHLLLLYSVWDATTQYGYLSHDTLDDMLQYSDLSLF